MLLKYFYDQKLAQASYMVGCQATGEALIVDPARDISQYMAAAEYEGLTITHITETHIHADYVSGSRELAHATGAALYLSDMGDENWKYSFTAPNIILVRDGDMFMVGNIRVEVLHTPGHTPEHISFMITDTAATETPIGIFTGDFLFVGDVGRPDLLEEAAGMVGTADSGARLQYRTVEQFKSMPDHLQVWPAHGAGSACGKALGAVPSSTLGYEKLVNPAFQFNNEQDFVDWLLDGQPEAPKYFAQMKKVNKIGSPLVTELVEPQPLDAVALKQAIADNALVLDMRHRDEFATAHVPGTVNIAEWEGACVNYAGWFVDYEGETYLLAEPDRVEQIVTNLRAIGVDRIEGYFTPDVIAEAEVEELQLISAADVADNMDNYVIIDVRGATEYAKGHIAGARNIPLGYLPRYMDELPRDRLLVTQCVSGYRGQIAASLLQKHGFKVANLRDHKDVWSKTLPVE
ncbi:MAG: rhodanese-like domain-containing protein [Chloroflexota bacterium]